MQSRTTIGLIDFEASSLNRTKSYPISVGIAIFDPTNHATPITQTYYRLIRPHHDWTDWNIASQHIHKISRDTLQRDGHSIDTIQQELHTYFADIPLFAGSSYDQYWMNRLYQHTNPSLTLYDFDSYLYEIAQDNETNIKKAIKKAKNISQHTHNALDDAIHMAHIAQQLHAIIGHNIPDNIVNYPL